MLYRLFRSSPRDGVLLLLAVLQGLLYALCCARAPSGPAAAPLGLGLAVLLWWNANTISHNHLHNPFFRQRWLNHLFSAYLSLLLGVPQALWRARHLWHHAGEPRRRFPLPRRGLLEIALCAVLFSVLVLRAPGFFFWVYLPGYLLGMVLCHLQGHYEHAGLPVTSEPGVSYYGRLYNRLWFNDGYHAEHHRFPGEHWTRLPQRRVERATVSALPPVLRWLGALAVRLNRVQARALCLLERLALHEGLIQRFMLRSHRRALCRLLARLRTAGLPAPRSAAIIGGGLFPRTALLLGDLLPGCHLTLIEADPAHLDLAQEQLRRAGRGALFGLCEAYDPRRHRGHDLLVVPLGFLGDRRALYQQREHTAVLIHDWIWRRGGATGVPISWLLLKRLNLVLPRALPRGADPRP